MICFDVRVLASTGRFLAALLLAGLGVVVSQAPAHACSCVTASTQTHTKDAQAIFTGTITDVTSKRKTDGQRGATTTYDVDVERVYKGAISTDTVVVTSDKAPGTCGLGELPADKRYVFFVRVDNSELNANSCGGTARASDKLVNKVESLLGGGRAPIAPKPAKAAFTQVGDDATTSLTRLAAPGAALSLLGLLGLIVVRRLGRRS